MRLVPAIALAAILLATPLLAPAARAQAPTLDTPVDCPMRAVCWVVQHVDHDPGPGAEDFTGGARTYDGHRGTDIGVTSYADMVRGVPVLAMADGVVAGVRDGEQDAPPEGFGEEGLNLDEFDGRECGNGVRIDHGGGWQTLYCHMRRGSIAVEEGQQVRSGARLGLMGQSGAAEFPHLHVTLLDGETAIDPYEPETGRALWSSGASEAMAYSPVDIFHLGFAPEKPDFTRVRMGVYDQQRFAPTVEALVFWVEFYAVHAGDEVSLVLTGPDGEVVAEDHDVLDAGHIKAWRFVGKRRRGPAWPAGVYEGKVTLTRSTDTRPLVQSRAITAEIR